MLTRKLLLVLCLCRWQYSLQDLSSNWYGRPCHNGHGSKWGGCCAPYAGELCPGLTQCGLGWGVLHYQVYVASSYIQLFGRNRHGPKTGSRAPFWGELGPHLAQCSLGWLTAAADSMDRLRGLCRLWERTRSKPGLALQTNKRLTAKRLTRYLLLY